MQFVSDSIELGFLDLGSKLAIIGDALLQAFMPKCEYKSFREEDRAWEKLQRPLLMAFVALVCLVIVVCTVISLNIVFLTDPAKRPFCGDRRLNSLMNVRGGDFNLFLGAFDLTDQEIAEYYWMVMFILLIIFLATFVYLVADKEVVKLYFSCFQFEVVA